jgi:tRNA A-37 threonylcarbamoyl transferase component Bud32/membrane-associated phospholipid phosphatase
MLTTNDVPADRSGSTSAPSLHPSLREAVRAPRRRRPTGEPPPLPYHLQTSGVGWLLTTGVLIALSIAVFRGGLRGPAIAVTLVDDAVVGWLAGHQLPGYVGMMRGLAALSSWWVLNGLGLGLLLTLLVLRRLRQLIVSFTLAYLVVTTAAVVAASIRRPRPFGVDIQAGWGGWALPSQQVMFLAGLLVGILYTLVPEGRWRNTGKWVAAALLTLTAVGRMALGADAPTDVLVGAAIGVTLPLVAFRMLTPSKVFPIRYRRGRAAHLDVTGPRGEAIRRGLEHQLGLVATEVEPFGLSGSAGSTPLRITVKGADGEEPTQLFGKLYAQSHLRADRSYKLGRELLHGRLEDEKPFNTVRRLVQQEDYALRLCRDAGLPTPRPYGVVELTPEREYLLATEFFADAVELGEATVDDQVIDDGLAIIRKLWEAGLAHRDIKPANLLVGDDRMLLIDVAFIELRPTPWRQAVDLANMMLCLALRSSPERVYQRALRQFSVEEITEGFAAARGLALPSQLRRMLWAQGRDVHGEFVRLLPTRPQPIPIQRWSARRVGLLGLVAALVVAIGAPILTWTVNNDVAVKTPLGVDVVGLGVDVGCGDLESLWLMAQSVPSASLVPCVESRRPGWTVANVAVNDGRSVITLDHDRAGAAAVVVRMAAAACDPAGAPERPAPEPGVRRFVREEHLAGEFTETWYDQFPGGCVTYRLHSTTDPRGQFANEAPQVLGFTTRQQLRQALSQRSGGRLQLDAGETR